MRNAKEHSRERFSRFAAGYVSSETHAHGSDLDRLVAIARPSNDWLMLDIATGGGHTALKFAPLVKHVTATDLSPQMLDAAQRNILENNANNVAFREADAENLPFDNAQFDLVTCRIAPHHFPNLQLFVSEVARVLKPDGLFLLQDQIAAEDATTDAYVNAFEKLRDPSHNRAERQSVWVQLVANIGLDVQHTEAYVKRHNLVKWAQLQDNNAATIAALQRRLLEAPSGAAEWLAAENAGTPSATFVNRHVLLLAQKR